MFRRHRFLEELPYLLHPVDRLVAVGRQGILHAAQICDGPDQLQQGGSALHRLQLRGGVEQFPHRFDLHGESGCADKLFIPNQQDELLPSGCLPDTLDLVIDPVQMARGLLLQLMGGGIQREAVAHPLGRWDRVLIENREERDGFVGDEVAHMDGGDRFRIHIFFLSIPCLVVCAAVKHDAPLRPEKLFSKPTELFAVVSVMINSFQ